MIDFTIENIDAVKALRTKFAPNDGADVEHGGRSGLGFGLVHYSLIRLYRPQRALVVGSRFGFIPACIATALKANGNGHLDFVDANYSDEEHDFTIAWGGVAHWDKGDFGSLSDVITIHIRKSAEFFQKSDSKFDYIYLDGGHDFETIAADFDQSAQQLAKGGLISLHDPLVSDSRFGISKMLESLDSRKWSYLILPPWPGLAIVNMK